MLIIQNAVEASGVGIGVAGKAQAGATRYIRLGKW